MAQAKEIGPFPGRVKPVRPGLYKRRSPKTGARVFAHWDGSQWGLFSSDPKKARAKRNRPSQYPALKWWGRAHPAS
jgi:hypothetical protein